MNPDRLTARQRSVLDYLQTRQSQGEPAPKFDDICAALGLASRGSLHKHIAQLIAMGFVEPIEGKQRGVHLAETPAFDPGEIPFYGRVAAGIPVDAAPDLRSVPVPSWLRGAGDCFVLEVSGDSMEGEGILDGDWIIVEACSSARNGDLVVALVDGSETTLKRIEQTPEHCTLVASNPSYPPMAYRPERVAIQGVVVSQIRRY